MALPFHQERTYWDLADLWRPVNEIPADAFPSATVYELAAEGVRCRFVTKSGVDVLEGSAGVLGESDDLITVDTVRFPVNTEIESSWCIVNRSTFDGSPGPYFGKVWIQRGEPKRRPNAPGLPPTGRTVAFVSKQPLNSIPPEIEAHYA